jgi:L-ascorbate metabolism protein UlaG (beta-lactamase superfamily)
MQHTQITLIGGPTVLIEMGGLRLLTDPTFDPAGSEYYLGPVTLKKTTGPALTAASLGHIDAVLLSHEQHSDNLDDTGRSFLSTVERVFTTPQSAANLGSNAIGLAPWQTASLQTADGQRLTITATPARHGPHGAEAYSGQVAGFVLSWEQEASRTLYFSGDTVWYEELTQVAQRFEVGVALLNLGAARLEVLGPVDLTMNAQGAIKAARTFLAATLVPVHVEGWAHFSESQAQANQLLTQAGLINRFVWLKPGVPALLEY